MKRSVESSITVPTPAMQRRLKTETPLGSTVQELQMLQTREIEHDDVLPHIDDSSARPQKGPDPTPGQGWYTGHMTLGQQKPAYGFHNTMPSPSLGIQIRFSTAAQKFRLSQSTSPLLATCWSENPYNVTQAFIPSTSTDHSGISRFSLRFYPSIYKHQVARTSLTINNTIVSYSTQLHHQLQSS